MCCFSGTSGWRRFRSVEEVSGTNIFARASGNGHQMLVYSMNLRSKIDLAMILPLPVPVGCPEDAVRFISLKAYPHFFRNMENGFFDNFLVPTDSATPPSGIRSRPRLQVHEVGDFEASYVPSMDDSDRLDKRFRIPAGLFDAVPAYRNFGFAVFKLKATRPASWRFLLRSQTDTKTIHPMAFEFRRADPDHLFFPTVHVHDGHYHPTAEFEHTLYCQGLEAEARDWISSHKVARRFIDVEKSAGVIEPYQVCFMRDLRGTRKNEDIIV
jgi:hypothetical protein